MNTEADSGRYADLDLWPTIEVVEAMMQAQLAAAAAASSAVPALAAAADAAAERLRIGAGRLAYAGAGTSGRVAVQDAVELGPTFDWPEDRLVLALAGGSEAMLRSVENAEDDEAAAIATLRDAGIGPADVVIGVAASGRTPFTVAALAYAREQGALTIAIAGNPDTPLLHAADHALLIETGSEVIAGSTRMKAGTAQKIALNLLSTAIMIRLGRTHAGLMVDMRLSNAKLRNRAVAMVRRIAGGDEETARAALERAGNRIKPAVLIARGQEPGAAAALLDSAGNDLRQALSRLNANADAGA